LLNKKAFLTEDEEVTFTLVDGTKKSVTINQNCLAFTVCQVPIIYKINSFDAIDLHFKNGTKKSFQTLELDLENSKKIVERTGEVSFVEVSLNEDNLR
jgi:hypothetical protein